MTSKAQAVKENIDKVNIFKIKNFCASEGTTKEVKRQPAELQKTVANHVLIKHLYPDCIKKNDDSEIRTNHPI